MIRLAFFVVVAAALQAASVRASLGTVAVFMVPEIQNVDMDDEVLVSLRLNTGGSNVGGGAVFLQFDAERLSFLSGEVDVGFWNLAFITTQPRQAQLGIVSFSLGSSTSVNASDVELAALRFRADGHGQARLQYLFNEAAEETAFTDLDLITRLPIESRDAVVAIAGPALTATPTSELTATPTAVAPTATPTATPTMIVTPMIAACIGDCTGDFAVTVDEVLVMVAIALGASDLADCARGDGNGDGDITVDEILAAVRNALEGCPLSS